MPNLRLNRLPSEPHVLNATPQSKGSPVHLSPASQPSSMAQVPHPRSGQWTRPDFGAEALDLARSPPLVETAAQIWAPAIELHYEEGPVIPNLRLSSDGRALGSICLGSSRGPSHSGADATSDASSASGAFQVQGPGNTPKAALLHVVTMQFRLRIETQEIADASRRSLC